MIVASCPKCRCQLQAPEALANRRVKCPYCQTIFTVISMPAGSLPARSSPPDSQIEPIVHTLTMSAALLESSASSFHNLKNDEGEFLRQRRGDASREGDGTDAPGVISLIFGCLAMLCALFGCLTFVVTAYLAMVFAVTAYVAVPFALIGGLVGFYGKRNMRVAGLLLNFLALIPAVFVTVFLVVSSIEHREQEARYQEAQRQEEAKLLAETRKNEAEARRRKAEAERIRQQAALKEQEARLLAQRRQQEREEARQKAEKEREQEELRAQLKQRQRESEARRKAEKEAKEEADREAARKTDLEKKGFPYYPRSQTTEDGRNAEEWYQLLRENPQNSRIYEQATSALYVLKEEAIPFLLDNLSRQTAPKPRHAALKLIRVEYVHSNDLHKLLSCLERNKNFQGTRLLTLQWLEKRAKDLKKDLVPQIESLIEDMLDNPNYREGTKEEIRGRLKTIRMSAK